MTDTEILRKIAGGKLKSDSPLMAECGVILRERLQNLKNAGLIAYYADSEFHLTDIGLKLLK